MAFVVVVMVVFLLMVQSCTNLSKKYPLHDLQYHRQEPWSCEGFRGKEGRIGKLSYQNNKLLIDVGKDYYDPMFQGLGYSYGRQFVNQDYGNIVMPNPDLANKKEVYHLMEKMGKAEQTERTHHSLTNQGPSKGLLENKDRKERLAGGGREWEHGVLGGGPDDAYLVAKFHHFPGGETAEWM
ncbi:MAG: hypothetical protein ACRC1D_00695 [Culicoidibacterales bacterium]